MSSRSRQSYNRVREHRSFDGQPSTELATGGKLRRRETTDGDVVVELLDVGGWRELKRWDPDA